jgi:hypothetical protein
MLGSERPDPADNSKQEVHVAVRQRVIALAGNYIKNFRRKALGGRQGNTCVD